MRLLSYLVPQVIYQGSSKFNRNIKIIESFGKKKLEVDGLIQSGNYIEGLWKKALRQIKGNIDNCLVMGLGGGSVVRVINKLFPNCHITGIEIDNLVVELGKKYLDLGKAENLVIFIQDAVKWVQSLGEKDNLFDLIIVDLYSGYQVVKQTEDPSFINRLKRIGSGRKLVVFNRFYFGRYKKETNDFLVLLNRSFEKILLLNFYTNLIIICEK